MTEEKIQPNANDNVQQAMPDPADRRSSQSDAAAADEAHRRAAPGRRPLFGK